MIGWTREDRNETNDVHALVMGTEAYTAWTRPVAEGTRIGVTVLSEAEGEAFDRFASRYFVATGDDTAADRDAQALAAATAWQAASAFFRGE